jgi:hypothetical protein
MVTGLSASGGELEGAMFCLAAIRARVALCPRTDGTDTTNETVRSTSDGFNAIFMKEFPPLETGNIVTVLPD